MVVVETKLSGRMTGLEAGSTHLKEVNAPTKQTEGMFCVTFCVTNWNSLLIDPQNWLPSTINAPATADQFAPVLGAGDGMSVQ
ncbi:MAG: hypothetical protein ABIR54_22385 [Burkholderiaceae bacterium]